MRAHPGDRFLCVDRTRTSGASAHDWHTVAARWVDAGPIDYVDTCERCGLVVLRPEEVEP